MSTDRAENAESPSQSVLPPERPALSLLERVDPRRAAAIFIDLQQDFCSPDGATARTGLDPAPMQAVLPSAKRLLAAARAQVVPVIHVRAEYNAPGNPYLSEAWLDQARRRWNGCYARVPMCVPGSWGSAICPDVTPASGEPVVVKHRFSAFAGTELDLLLRSRGIRTLVVAGVISYVCGESTVRDAFFADYHVVVCSDCVAGRDSEWHRHSLAIMDWGFAEVVPSASVLEAWAEIATARAGAVAGDRRVDPVVPGRERRPADDAAPGARRPLAPRAASSSPSRSPPPLVRRGAGPDRRPARLISRVYLRRVLAALVDFGPARREPNLRRHRLPFPPNVSPPEPCRSAPRGPSRRHLGE